ncbi:MAG: CvpA family protein [Chitinophagaceae bacterium]|jgi:membrane protein required for colicin V production
MVIDIITGIILAFAIYKGWTKGFTMAIFTFASYFIAVLLALQFSGMVAGYLKEYAKSDSKWYTFLSFLLVLIAGIIAVRIIGKLMEKSAQVLMLGLVNKLLGILFFASIYITVFSILLVYAEKFEMIDPYNAGDSKTYSYQLRFGKWLMHQLSEWLPAVKHLFNDTKNAIQEQINTKLK